MFEQKTLRSEVSFQGHGLHTGKPVSLRVLPAPPNSGIKFVRTDLDHYAISARAENLGDTRLSTTLARNGIQVGTVEHLLASLAGLGIDNAQVELDGPEVPILDGSASPFVEAFVEVGLLRQESVRDFLTVLKPV